MIDVIAQVNHIFDDFEKKVEARKIEFDKVLSQLATDKQKEVLYKATNLGWKCEKLVYSPDNRRIALWLSAPENNQISMIYPNGEFKRNVTLHTIKPF